MPKKIIIFGGEGIGATIAMSIKDANDKGYREYEIYGFLNDKDKVETIAGFPVVGGKANLPELVSAGFYFINAVQKIDGQKYRVDLFESFNIPDNQLAIFIHPSAYVSPLSKIKCGCVVMQNAFIDNSVCIEKNVRVCQGVSIHHHSIVGEYSFISGQSCIGSYTQVGKAVYFGYNCTVGQKLLIGDYAVIGMGAVVTKNVKHFELVVGNPAKLLRLVEDIF